MKLLKIETITGQVEVVTGLHIGDNKDVIEIGGIDNTVIKHPLTQEPYIPGSSLKGKMRSRMEIIEGKVDDKDIKGEPCGCANIDCMVCRVFGPHKNTKHSLGPTRIIVRDAMLSETSREKLRETIKSGKAYLEIKTENIINRKVGTSQDFRHQERVPAGAIFDLEIVVQTFEELDQYHDVVAYVKKALKAVEVSYIGGSGSRGCGKVKFTGMNLDGESFVL